MTADTRPDNELLRLLSEPDFGLFQRHLEWFGGLTDLQAIQQRSRHAAHLFARAGLEQRACRCHDVVKRHFERVLLGVYPNASPTA